jgi:hypothetical protein
LRRDLLRSLYCERFRRQGEKEKRRIGKAGKGRELIVERSRGEINEVFILMIPEISTRNLKISAPSKTL